MKKRRVFIHVYETHGIWTATVSVMSMGAMPMGTPPYAESEIPFFAVAKLARILGPGYKLEETETPRLPS